MVADFVNGEYAIPCNLLCPTYPAKFSQILILSRMNETLSKAFSQTEINELIMRGFITNYTHAWYIAHTGPKTRKLRTSGELIPLGLQRDTYLAAVSSSRVPLIANASNDTLDNADQIDTPDGMFPTVKALTDGPIIRDARSGFFGYQDYTAFDHAHGRGKSTHGGAKGHDWTTSHFLFADGHVADSKDLNGDREFGGRRGMDFTGYAIACVNGGNDIDGDGIPSAPSKIDEAFTLDGLNLGADGFLVLINDPFGDVPLFVHLTATPPTSQTSTSPHPTSPATSPTAIAPLTFSFAAGRTTRSSAARAFMAPDTACARNRFPTST